MILEEPSKEGRRASATAQQIPKSMFKSPGPIVETNREQQFVALAATRGELRPKILRARARHAARPEAGGRSGTLN